MALSPRQALDLDWVRAHFPALEGDWVLFDNAGGSAPLETAVARVGDYMKRWPVQLGASYEPSAEASRRLDASRASLARLLACGAEDHPDPREVVFGSSTTSLIGRLARAMSASLRAGDEIIVTDVDHEANITPWRRLQETGVIIRTWSLNKDSRRLELADLRPLLGDRTRLVCFTHASNVLGEVMPIAEVTSLAHQAGARVCVDGVAYAPHRPLRVREWDVDFYAFSLYKVYGPHCAVLYGRRDLLDELTNLNHDFMSAHDVPGKLELGAFPYELLYGAGAVPEYLSSLGERHGGVSRQMETAYHVMAAQEHILAARLLEFLCSRPAVDIMGPALADDSRMPTVSFTVGARRSSEIPPLCDPHGIGIRWGHFYAPRLIKALGLEDRDGVVRASMVHYNSLDEVDRLIGVLDRVL